jgi:hypothetical protein
MFRAVPLHAFELAGRKVLTCRVEEGNPHAVIGKPLVLSLRGQPDVHLTLRGVSTASRPDRAEFDLAYDGPDLRTLSLSNTPSLTEAEPAASGASS